MNMKKILFFAIFFSCLLTATAGFCETAKGSQFLVLTIDNKIISPVIADYVSGGVDQAEKESCQGLIILMDTPGGLLESTRTIVKKIINSPVPVIVYVAPGGSRAGSAGVFIAYAAHIAAMAPSTNIGAAHPVIIGKNPKGERSLRKAIEDLTELLRSERYKKNKKQEIAGAASPKEISENPEEDKVLNDTLAWISSLAKNRNRNADWARLAVTESSSLTEKEALEKKVINLVANNLDELLGRLDNATFIFPDRTFTLHTKDSRLIFKNLTLRQNILNSIINPNIAYILMLIGFLSLFVEITHPGVIFPGVLGLICLVIAFYAFAMLPVNFAGFVLILIGIILFIAEALTPVTFGLLTLGGAVCMLLGSLMLIDTPFAAMRISLNVILPFILAVAAIVIFLVTNVMKAHRKKTTTGADALIGKIATASTDIAEEGQVFLDGEIWTAINRGAQPIKKGEEIKVVGVDKVKLLVSK
jgi:membrane-bound serine protease (ClpP class)